MGYVIFQKCEIEDGDSALERKNKTIVLAWSFQFFIIFHFALKKGLFAITIECTWNIVKHYCLLCKRYYRQVGLHDLHRI